MAKIQQKIKQRQMQRRYTSNQELVRFYWVFASLYGLTLKAKTRVRIPLGPPKNQGLKNPIISLIHLSLSLRNNATKIQLKVLMHAMHKEILILYPDVLMYNSKLETAMQEDKQNEENFYIVSVIYILCRIS